MSETLKQQTLALIASLQPSGGFILPGLSEEDVLEDISDITATLSDELDAALEIGDEYPVRLYLIYENHAVIHKTLEELNAEHDLDDVQLIIIATDWNTMTYDRQGDDYSRDDETYPNNPIPALDHFLADYVEHGDESS